MLKEHSQLWDRTDLDTSFSHFEKSSPQPDIKVHLEFHFHLRSVLLDFQSVTEKPVFEYAFAHPIKLFFYHICLKQYGPCLFDLQISYEIASNVHVCKLTVFL